MQPKNKLSRRHFLATASGVAATGCWAAASVVEKEKLPVIPKRVEKAFRAPGKAPNDLQDAPDGLWILDQVDPNKVFKVRYEDGSVLAEIQTESIHGSGITYGNGAL